MKAFGDAKARSSPRIVRDHAAQMRIFIAQHEDKSFFKVRHGFVFNATVVATPAGWHQGCAAFARAADRACDHAPPAPLAAQHPDRSAPPTCPQLFPHRSSAPTALRTSS